MNDVRAEVGVEAEAAALVVRDWGGIVWQGEGDDGAAESSVAPLSALPGSLRRRLGSFERAVVQAVLGVARPQRATRITLGSRYGNLAGTGRILQELAVSELPSPTLFSHSVLNAACGVADQIRNDRSSHSAISAGAGTLAAALTDTWLQLQDSGGVSDGTDDGSEAVIVLADLPLPTIYGDLDPAWDMGLCVGMRVALADGHVDSGAGRAAGHPLGRSGYGALLDGLRTGGRFLGFTGGRWSVA